MGEGPTTKPRRNRVASAYQYLEAGKELHAKGNTALALSRYREGLTFVGRSAPGRTASAKPSEGSRTGSAERLRGSNGTEKRRCAHTHERESRAPLAFKATAVAPIPRCATVAQTDGATGASLTESSSGTLNARTRRL